MNKKVLVAIFTSLFIFGLAIYWYFGLRTDNNEQYRKGSEEKIIYESEAETADQCTSKETFDPGRKVCKFECASEEECAKIEEEINAELDSLGDEYVESAENFSEREKGDIQGTTIATYRVNSDESITLTKGEVNKQHTEAWETFAKISPDTFTARFMKLYEVTQDEQDDTLAYVQDDDDNGRWTLGINFGTYGKEGKRNDLLTLVHEFGHVLTLNNSQVEKQKTDGCKTYDTGDGCALPSSFLNAFVQNFWPKSDIADAQKKNSELYVKKEASFVTEYAATSPEEDMTESFALFILEKKPIEDATIAQKKVSFFYAYSELVQLRSDMRKEIGGVVLERKRNR